MGNLLNGFRTKEGDSLKKIEGDDGDTYFFKNGSFTSESTFHGHKSRLSHVITSHKGELPSQLRDAVSLQELEDRTEIPFTATNFDPIREGESKQDSLRAEQNRWLGFYLRNTHMEREEAAKEYLKFREEIREAEDADVRAAIRERYNLGGS